MKFIASTAFALESVTADELRRLGLNNVRCENNRVLFEGTQQDAATACIWLRSADRVSLLVAEFVATSFDVLFEGIAGLNWSGYLKATSRIIVNARCVRSQLMSQSDVQSIGKKAIITALQRKHRMEVFPETAEENFIHISILNDKVTVSIDLCGDGLHKRGYRVLNAQAPLRETFAAALLLLSGYNGEGPLLDPFCGSGTIAIEGAMLAKNMAPGRMRNFAAENYTWCDPAVFANAKSVAIEQERATTAEIFCGDISPEMVDMTAYHAERARVKDKLSLRCMDACAWDVPLYCGHMITNPPYGERLLDREQAFELLHNFSALALRLTEQYWNLGILTPEARLESALFQKAAGRRKLYNSNIPCTFYTFKNNA